MFRAQVSLKRLNHRHRRYSVQRTLNTQIEKAAEAQKVFQTLKNKDVAAFLASIANNLDKRKEVIVTTASKESNLPTARCQGELTRTINQLLLFSNIVSEGSWVDARLNGSIRSMLVPIGPVAVFGASNFPLAFSTTGGDTASALAAKCSVVYKTHPAHPDTTQIAYSAVKEALDTHKLPAGVFQVTEVENPVGVPPEKTSLYGLVSNPNICAVGFTGSHKVGKLIMKIASERPSPIPVYAEMGSVNPVFILPDALATNSQSIAEGLANSVTLGVGQFCTNPGLVFLVGNGKDSNFESFINHLKNSLSKIPPGHMLTKNIRESFQKGVVEFQKIPGLKLEHAHSSSLGNVGDVAGSVVFSSDVHSFLKYPSQYQQELFGPSTIIIKCDDIRQLHNLSNLLEGQLTATFHGTQLDLAHEHAVPLISSVSKMVGRILWGGFPTGVEVNHAMNHGGPYPASSDQRATSVGARAILRWVRPLCYQGFPEEILPPELQANNPLNVIRLVDGKLVSPSK